MTGKREGAFVPNPFATWRETRREQRDKRGLTSRLLDKEDLRSLEVQLGALNIHKEYRDPEGVREGSTSRFVFISREDGLEKGEGEFRFADSAKGKVIFSLSLTDELWKQWDHKIK